MTFLIDRRSNPKQKSAVNRQRFLRRYRDRIKESVAENLRGRTITEDGKGEKISIPEAGIKGVFCGGTEMSPQTVRFLVEEVLEEEVAFVPTYGNTLMGLAAHKPLTKADGYAITYYAPQPRAVLRVTDPEDSR